MTSIIDQIIIRIDPLRCNYPTLVLLRCEKAGEEAARAWYHAEEEWYTPDAVEYLNVVERTAASAAVLNEWIAYLNTNRGEDAMKEDPRFLAYLRGWNRFREANPM